MCTPSGCLCAHGRLTLHLPTPNGQHHHHPQVRKRALQFFNSKVQARKATMNRAEVGLLLELLTVRMLALVKPITTPNP